VISARIFKFSVREKQEFLNKAVVADILIISYFTLIVALELHTLYFNINININL